MAFTAAATVNSAIDTLLTVATEDPTLPKAAELRRKILHIATIIEQMDSEYDGFFAGLGVTESNP